MKTSGSINNIVIKSICTCLIIPLSVICLFAGAEGILDYSVVKKRTETNSQKQKIDGGNLARRARYLYRQKKNPAASIPLFEKALADRPDSFFYYEYGNALIDVKRYSDSIKAYEISGRLGYDKKYTLLYNSACAASLMRNKKLALKYLSEALGEGYPYVNYIKKDSDLAFIRNTSEFIRILKLYSVNLSETEKRLVGAWHAAPAVAAGYDNIYQFFPNRKFTFRFSESDCSKREISFSGKWTVEKGILYLTATSRKHITGGKLVEASGSCGSDKMISGGRVIESVIKPAGKVTYKISEIVNDDKFGMGMKRDNVKIDNQRFWRLSSKPDDI